MSGSRGLLLAVCNLAGFFPDRQIPKLNPLPNIPTIIIQYIMLFLINMYVYVDIIMCSDCYSSVLIRSSMMHRVQERLCVYRILLKVLATYNYGDMV